MTKGPDFPCYRGDTGPGRRGCRVRQRTFAAKLFRSACAYDPGAREKLVERVIFGSRMDEW
jgi:hypothetical protein